MSMRLLTPLARHVRPSKSPCHHCHSSSSSSSTSTPHLQITKPPRVRFAPSPTGHLHLGGLRTALFNYLTARRHGGSLILRIEDTDQARLVKGAVDSLRSSLEWAGLEVDEGVEAGGAYGPYTQSVRLDLYQTRARQLLQSDKAYECFCTPDELIAIKHAQNDQGIRRTYDGRCRLLTDEDRARRKKAGQKYVIRYKDDGILPDLPEDVVFGDIKAHSDFGTYEVDDFVILKSDGYPTYHLASVVDDHEMEISHVLRGEEWLASLPKHVNLYEAFGWVPPVFGHLPLLMNPDGTKLSKRKGDVRVDDYRDKGYEPDAILNFLSLLGWDAQRALQTHNPTLDPAILDPALKPGHNPLHEVFTLPQLIAAFDVSQITRRKAGVNVDKLDFLNRMHLRRKAGRLGKDGLMVNMGKEGLGVAGYGAVKGGGEGEGDVGVMEVGMREREALLDRVHEMWRGLEDLEGDLVNDRKYVEEVFNAELPRVTVINDFKTMSKFFFVVPNYEDEATMAMIKDRNLSLYVKSMRAVIILLEEKMLQLGAIRGVDMAVTEDMVWDAVKEVVKTKVLKVRSELLIPMRHALTGVSAGPGVPTTICVLGPERALARLKAGYEFVKPLRPGHNPRGGAPLPPA